MEPPVSIDDAFFDRMDAILDGDKYADVLSRKMAAHFQGAVKTYYNRHHPIGAEDQSAYYIKFADKQGGSTELFHLSITVNHWPDVHFTDLTGGDKVQWWYTFDAARGLQLHGDHDHHDVPQYIKIAKIYCDEVITAAKPDP
jgi:hypothetical protein